MSKKRIVILGAGLAGLSVAWHLQRKGIECLIFEKESEVGGLCRSKNINGFTFDYDGHLLHFKHSYTFNLIKNLLGENLVEHKRSAWVYSYDRYTPYPFQANLYGLPKSVVQDCLLGFIKVCNNGRKKTNNNHSFHDWIIQTLGKGIARHLECNIYDFVFYTLKLNKLCCEVFSFNEKVISIHEKFGSIVEGKLIEHICKSGKFYDIVTMGITRNRWNDIKSNYVYDKINIAT